MAGMGKGVELFAGTSGYAYEEWRGRFYPEELPAEAWLGHYAGRLPAVEINASFYRIPKRPVVEGWAAEVPPFFRFACKASRRLTHQRRLRGADVGRDLAFMLEQFEGLGERLGAVLFQLPPNLKADLTRLEAFLELLPPCLPTAFEFRHPSWDPDAVDALLAPAGAVRVAGAGSPSELTRTAPFAYLRLRAPDYSDAELTAWRARLEELDLERAFVFFKHEEDAAGPALAARFLRRT